MKRPLVPPLIAMMLGIYLAEPAGLPYRVLMVISFLLLGIRAMTPFLPTVHGWRAWCGWVVIGLYFFLGLLLAHPHNQLGPPSYNLVQAERLGQGINIEGRVIASTEYLPERARISMQIEQIHRPDNSVEAADGQLLLTVRGEKRLIGLGDRLRTALILNAPRSPGNPGELDYKAFLASKRIHFSAALRSPESLVRLGGVPASDIWMFFDRLRSRIYQDISARVPSGAREIMLALFIGQQKLIPPDVLQAFARTGTSHILSISGLHVGIFALLSNQFVLLLISRSNWLMLRWNRRKLAAFASLFPSIGYILISGGSIAAQRSFTMVLVHIVAVVLGRSGEIMNTLALAAGLILVGSPGALYNPAFQLSFISVFALVALGPAWQEWLDLHLPEPTGLSAPSPNEIRPKFSRRASLGRLVWKMFHYGLSLLGVSVIASLATLPIVLYHFHSISLIAPLANLVVVPLSSLIIPIGLLAIPCLFGLPSLATLLLALCARLVEGMIWFCTLLSHLPLAAVSAPALHPLFGLPYFGLLLLWPKRQLFWWVRPLALLGLLTLLAGIAWKYREIQANPHLEVTMIDVGQGDAILVSLPHGRRMLIDAGGSYSSSYDPGQSVISPYLHGLGINRLDWVVLTHLHPDHFGGLAAVIREFRPKEVWSGLALDCVNPGHPLKQAVEQAGIPWRVLGAATPVQNFGPVRLEFLWPSEAMSSANGNCHLRGSGTNNHSLVMRLVWGEVAFLLPGDIEKESEAELIRRLPPKQLRASVIKVPHHGSLTASSLDFIQVVRPRFAVFTVGYRNKFAFPRRPILRRYHKVGVKVLRSDVDGAIRFETDGRELWLETGRKVDHRGEE
jgi:competence protein ComEC